MEHYKTNIRCNGCIEKVAPILDEYAGAGHWKVDLESPDRILTLNEPIHTAEVIHEQLKQAGYTTSRIH